MKVNYEFRPSKGDLLSIAYDLGIEEISAADIRDWVTMVLCDELKDLRLERLKE